MTVPFAKLRNVATAALREMEELSIAELFLRKCFPDRYIAKVVKDMKKFMSDNPEATASSAMHAVVTDIPFEVTVSAKSCNAHCVLVGNFRNNSVIKWAMSIIGDAHNRKEEAAVLFKLTNLGVFVLHNISMPMQSNPRIIIPASSAGVEQVQLTSLCFFADDFLGKRSNANR